jgi:hypothetical protein
MDDHPFEWCVHLCSGIFGLFYEDPCEAVIVSVNPYRGELERVAFAPLFAAAAKANRPTDSKQRTFTYS